MSDTENRTTLERLRITNGSDPRETDRQPEPTTEALHRRCGETTKCPCWTTGALAEAAARKPRPQARQLQDYIRALSETRPDWDDADLARAAAEVFVR